MNALEAVTGLDLDGDGDVGADGGWHASKHKTSAEEAAAEERANELKSKKANSAEAKDARVAAELARQKAAAARYGEAKGEVEEGIKREEEKRKQHVTAMWQHL